MFDLKKIEQNSEYAGSIHNTCPEVLYAIEKVAKKNVERWSFREKLTVDELAKALEEERHDIWFGKDRSSDEREKVLAALPANPSENLVFWGSVFAEFDGEKWERRHATFKNLRMPATEVREEYGLISKN